MCALFAHEGGSAPEWASFELSAPSGQVVSSLAVVRDPDERLVGRSDVATLIGEFGPGGERRYVGSVETIDVGGVQTELFQVAIELDQFRPVGPWTVVARSGDQVASGATDVDFYCGAEAPSTYAGSDPALLDLGRPRYNPRFLFDAPLQSVGYIVSCRSIADERGRPFADVVAEFEQRAAFGGFTLATEVGGCGIAGRLDYVFVDLAVGDTISDYAFATLRTHDRSPDATYTPAFYWRGDVVTLFSTIECPPMPEQLFVPDGDAFAGWAARPLPFDEVLATLSSLRIAYAVWDWTSDPACDAEGALVTRYLDDWYSGATVVPGHRTPRLVVECEVP